MCSHADKYGYCSKDKDNPWIDHYSKPWNSSLHKHICYEIIIVGCEFSTRKDEDLAKSQVHTTLAIFNPWDHSSNTQITRLQHNEPQK
jgi:hypothetical protein